jgi:hypothetical protein
MDDVRIRARRLGLRLAVVVAVLFFGPILLKLWLERGTR